MHLTPRSAFASVFAVSALLVACSSGSTSGTGDGGVIDSGTSGTSGASGASGTSGGAATAQFIVIAKLVVGTKGAAACPEAGTALTAGAFAPPRPVVSGASEGGAIVNVTCKVAASASGFDVDTSITFSNPANPDITGLTVRGTTSAAGAASNGGVALASKGRTFSSSDCVFDTTATTGTGGVAAGRYWATFKCTDAPDATAEHSCGIDGEIRLENCAQK